MDGSPMCKKKTTDSETIQSKKKCLLIKMIHQVTQLQKQSMKEQNNKYFISSHKMYHCVPIYNQKNSFHSYCFRGMLA